METQLREKSLKDSKTYEIQYQKTKLVHRK
jgi:hypothetical protein